MVHIYCNVRLYCKIYYVASIAIAERAIASLQMLLPKSACFRKTDEEKGALGAKTMIMVSCHYSHGVLKSTHVFQWFTSVSGASTVGEDSTADASDDCHG